MSGPPDVLVAAVQRVALKCDVLGFRFAAALDPARLIPETCIYLVAIDRSNVAPRLARSLTHPEVRDASLLLRALNDFARNLGRWRRQWDDAACVRDLVA